MDRWTTPFLLAVAAVALAVPFWFAPSLVAQPAAQPDADADAGDSDEAAVSRELAWRFVAGESFYMRESFEQQTRQELFGRVQSASMTSTTYSQYRVLDVDADNIATIMATFAAVTMTNRDPMGNELEYDSRNPEHRQLAEDPSIRPMAMLAGKSVRFRVDPAGNVTDVKGYADIFQEWIDEMRQSPGMEVMVELLGAMMSNDYFASQLESYFKLLPGRTAKHGETWNHTGQQLLPGIGKLLQEQKITYERDEERNERDEAVMAVRGTVSLSQDEGGGASLWPEGTEVSLTNATINGTAHYDHAQHLLNEVRTTIGFTMEVSFSGGRMEQGQVVTSTAVRMSAEEFQRETRRQGEGQDDGERDSE